jgi:hypothetical protein
MINCDDKLAQNQRDALMENLPILLQVSSPNYDWTACGASCLTVSTSISTDNLTCTSTHVYAVYTREGKIIEGEEAKDLKK